MPLFPPQLYQATGSPKLRERNHPWRKPVRSYGAARGPLSNEAGVNLSTSIRPLTAALYERKQHDCIENRPIPRRLNCWIFAFLSLFPPFLLLLLSSCFCRTCHWLRLHPRICTVCVICDKKTLQAMGRSRS